MLSEVYIVFQHKLPELYLLLLVGYVRPCQGLVDGS